MNCRRFEAIWNEMLDSRSESPTGLEQALEVHASTCERCRRLSGPFQVLRRAGSVLGRPPSPSPGSIDCLYALTMAPTSPIHSQGPERPRLWSCVVLASAAAVLAMAWLGRPGPAPEGLATRPVASPVPLVDATRPIGTALAEATEATLELAREASAPASRIGRDMLNRGNLVEASTEPRPELDSSTPGVLQSVGERVSAGVKPISGSARHAFSFLLGPPPESDPAPREARGSL